MQPARGDGTLGVIADRVETQRMSSPMIVVGKTAGLVDPGLLLSSLVADRKDGCHQW